MTGPDDRPSAGAGRHLLRRLLRPRLRRVDLSVAVLLGLLGFAAAVQVRSAQDDGLLASAREEDLVQILDDLSNRERRLQREVATLTAARERLGGSGQAEAALEEARRRTQVLGVLTGTVAARGPGIVLTLNDPEGQLRADVLLDALEELRGAGAEAVQVQGSAGAAEGEGGGAGPVVRVVASTALLDAPEGEGGGVLVDGTLLRAPYRFTVLGEPGTLASAMAIPGGVEDVAARAGGSAVVTQSEQLAVTALRVLERPRYARPAGPSD